MMMMLLVLLNTVMVLKEDVIMMDVMSGWRRGSGANSLIIVMMELYVLVGRCRNGGKKLKW